MQSKILIIIIIIITSSLLSFPLTVVTQHHSQVVLSPGADVGKNRGGVRGAEAEAELLLCQVALHTQGS